MPFEYLDSTSRPKFEYQDAAPAPAAAPPSPPPKKSFIDDALQYYTEDLPGIASDFAQRTEQRFSRINAPTIVGAAAADAVPAPFKNIANAAASAPEQVARTVGAVVGTVADAPMAAVEAAAASPIIKRSPPAKVFGFALRSLDAALGGTLSNAFKGVSEDVKAQVDKIKAPIANWWGGLSEAERANWTATADNLNVVAPELAGAILSKAGKGFGNAVKNQISQATKLDRDLVQATADSPEYLQRLKDAGISEGNKGFDAMVADVQNIIRNEDRNARVAAKQRISDVNAAMDASIAQANADTDAFVSTLKDKTNKALEDAISFTPEEIRQSDRGINLKEQLSKARDEVGKQFGAKQAEYLGPDVVATPLSVNAVGLNDVQAGITDVLKKAGYNGKAHRMVEKIGNTPLTKGDLDDALEFVNAASEAQNIDHLFTQLRTLRRLHGTKRPDGNFYNSTMLGEIDGIYQKAIEKQLNAFSDAPGGKDLVLLWRANNEQFKTANDLLADVEKGLNVTGGTPESIYNRIKTVGVGNLLSVKNLAATRPELSGVWPELQGGFKDEIVMRSMGKDGSLDVDKLEKRWRDYDRIDTELKSTLLGAEQVKKIDDAILAYRRSVDEIKNVEKTRESTINALKDRAEADTFAARKIPGKMRPDTRETMGADLSGTAAYSRIRNIGSKTGQSAESMKTLEVLDAFYGTDFAKRADDFWNARKLGINDRGVVPTLPLDYTGRSMLGMAIAHSLKIFNGIPVVGPLFSTVIGLSGQSPAGAIAVYKTIDKLARLKKVSIVPTQMGVAAASALASRSAYIESTPPQ